WIGKHRIGIWLRKAGTSQPVKKFQGFPSSHIGVSFSILQTVAELFPTVNDLFRRTSAHAQLQPTFRDQVGGTRLFYHVEWIFIAHIDDAGTDLYLSCFGTNCR